MTHRLHLLVEQLDLATEHALASAEALGPRAYVPPVPGQWAAAQVIHHVLSAELKIVDALQKALSNSQDTWRLGTLTNRLRSAMLRLALRLPGLKFKVPPTLPPRPPRKTSLRYPSCASSGTASAAAWNRCLMSFRAAS